MNSIRLCLVLHNHQPVGNFDGVFEQAYQDSYLPFLDVFESYSDLKISLHTSGPLMEWLDERHGEYIDRVARLVRAGRIEIVGGPFYEPIMTMIPPRDRVGQITTYTRWLENRLGANVQGMWMPERVWEQSLTGDLVAAGMKYTVLDDFHFKNAGLTEDQLQGYYLTEDDGKVLCVFPGSEPLRYTIPFQSPQASIDYLRGIKDKYPGAVVVFGDDGEKFGTWPDTKKHVYENGWLRQFFDALLANRDWLHLSTLAEANENTPPVGKIYLPDGSYREMTEWALPVNQQLEYDHVVHELEHDPRWPQIKRFVRGGFWRNFKVKYPETNEMYSRMMMTSRRFAQAERDGITGTAFDNARQALYRGQCNCPYWHGAFGGTYLPHLRNAIFTQLIAADNLIDQATGKTEPYVEATTDDYNFDLKQEVRLASDKLIALIAPAQGGMLYELDVRTICHNLGATLTRRPESYHRKVLAGPPGANGSVASIHDRVVFKQPNLDQRLQYDPTQRKSLLDHFYDLGATVHGVSRGEARDLGDFVTGIYEAKIRRSADRIQVQLTRPGIVNGHEIRITKAITMTAGSPTLELAYQLENLPPNELFHFAVELNFAGLPSGADDRYFHNLNGIRFGQLGTHLDLQDANQLGLTDEWLGIDVQLVANKPTGFWTFPIETVSQSEGGFELVHQSVAVLPHWHVRGDVAGKWTATIQLTASTALAERRMQPERAAVFGMIGVGEVASAPPDKMPDTMVLRGVFVDAAQTSLSGLLKMPTITWLGHACWLIQTGEHSILLDPFLDSSPTAACKAKDIRADYVLVSHGHFDHCAEAAEVANNNKATLIANYEIATWFETKHSVKNTIGMNLGGSTPTKFGRVTMTLAWHSSVLPDGTYGGAPAGFVLKLNEGPRLYFACDTALFSDMRLIGEPNLDLAVLPIGDLYTMGIDDSLAAIKLLQPKVVAPFALQYLATDRADADAWAKRVSQETTAQPRVLQPGESFSL